MGRWALKKKVIGLERDIVNARQAAREAAKKITELERVAALNKADIVDYNKCIEHMISGGSPCDYCEDLQECQLEAKGKTGCSEWMLRSQPKPQEET